MNQNNKSILFVTDELFLPSPHNASCQTYARLAQDYAHDGYDVFCVSFYRDRQQAADRDVIASYSSLFSEFLLVPGWNGGGTLIGMLGLGLREMSRWTTGNVFSTNPLLSLLLGSQQAAIIDLVKRRNVGTIYFHKPHTALLLRNILPKLRPATLVLQMHDDFVARASQYGHAYSSLFDSLSSSEIAAHHLVSYVRHRFSRINLILSRDVETALLTEFDQILISSEEEYRRYRARPRFGGKVVHQNVEAGLLASSNSGACRVPRGPHALALRFDAGFIGSADPMNLDALVYFRNDILPRIRRRRPDFRFLIAGSIGKSAIPLVRSLEYVTVWPTLEHVKTFYTSINVAVIPLRYGSGISMRVLEALSFGCPVVSTPVGVRGLPSEKLAGTSITEDSESFSSCVLERIESTGA